jgi:hypothetical protein
MTPSRCAYCGALAENPATLIWAVAADGPGQAPLGGTLALCIACSRSWCRVSSPPTPARPPRVRALRHRAGQGRRAA